MKYFFYEPANGKIVQFTDTPDELKTCFIPGLELIEADKYTQGDMATLQVVNKKLVQVALPPLLATVDDIKKQKAILEYSPILVNGYLVDCDLNDEARMSNCLTNWNHLPVISGQLEVINNVRKIYWTLADNTKICITKNELVFLYNEMLKLRSVRAFKLHFEYQRIKAMPDVTLDYVNDPANWLV